MQGLLAADPEKAFDIYDRAMTERLERLPKCKHCGEPIQDDYAIEYDGDLYCEECFDWHIKDLMKVPIEVD